MLTAREHSSLVFFFHQSGGVEMDKVDKWINARDFMLPGRAGERDKVDKWINARDFQRASQRSRLYGVDSKSDISRRTPPKKI